MFRLFKDGALLLECTTIEYLDAFVEDNHPTDDCLWVELGASECINYKELAWIRVKQK